MKINYHKLEVYTIGIEENESKSIAEAFNCKLGNFPMKYLVLPISFKRLSKEELSFSAGKAEKIGDMEVQPISWWKVNSHQFKSD